VEGTDVSRGLDCRAHAHLRGSLGAVPDDLLSWGTRATPRPTTEPSNKCHQIDTTGRRMTLPNARPRPSEWE
jgi:hypothetical protein